MKKMFIVLIGLVFVLSTTGLPLAQEKAAPGKTSGATKSAEPASSAGTAKAEGAKPEAVKKEASAEPMEYRMGGVITNLSAAAKKITIEQHQVKRERMVTLTVSEKTAKKLSDLKVGDSVNVWVRGRQITDLQKVS